MLHRPKFRSCYHVEIVEGSGIVLLSENGHSILQGRLYELVTPCIDGCLFVDEIVDRLREQASPPEVHDALLQLEKKGCLAESDESLSETGAALSAIHDIAPPTAAHRLMETLVSITSFGAIPVEPFQASLQSLGVRVGAPGQLGIVLSDDYLRSGLQAYNQVALHNERPWMLIKPVGREIWIGPVFQPGKTGCWECLAHRLRGNRELEIFLQVRKKFLEPLPVASSFTSTSQQIAFGLAAIKIAEWIVLGESPELEGKILTLDVRSCQIHTHTLVWRPQCPACGDPMDCLDLPAQPILLEGRKKTFLQDGGHRVLCPEVTLRRYEHHVSPITGAVSRLERYDASMDGVIHSYGAQHNFASRRCSLEDVREGLRICSGGKGASDLQAKTSGLCEALERYSGVFRGDEPRRRSRLKDLGDPAIHPNVCMLFSEKQYQRRSTWNSEASPFNYVPVPFKEDAEIEWTPIWSLTRRESRFLPTAFCFYHHPSREEETYCVACSNGNAAGNTLEEAILQGALELVERDSVAIWWYNRVRRPAVALDSFDEPYLGKIVTFLRDHGRDLWVLDLTSDLQIPVYVAMSRRTDCQPEDIVLGFGADLDPKIALMRGVTELNQMLSWILGNENNSSMEDSKDHDETLAWLRTATLTNQPYLVPDSSAPPRTPSDYPRRWTDDVREDVLTCQTLFEGQGLEMLVLDQTRPDIGLPVVKVIVPGLRHFRPRFAPGRLYDVPVKLGWLTQPLTEEQLNPILMPQ